MAKKKSRSPIGERKRAKQSLETPPSEQRPVAPAAIKKAEQAADRPAAVVGVGASAGGLDAFRQWFAAMPSDTGMAFVLIQHLDPNHPSLTAELLSKQTKMPVVQVTDGMHILPNHVFVIPPKTYLTIRGETLHLTEPLERRGLRVPIEINQPPMAMETIRDISNRKRLEQQIAEIAEQERQTLGRELHDTIGQQLSGLSMMVATLKEQVGDGSVHATAIDMLSAIVEQTKQQLRGLARGLVAIPIDAKGLPAALRDLAIEVTQLYKIKCQFDCLDDVALDDDFAATQLFLIAREAANNAARHSHARQIVIELDDHDGLRTSVRDDGRGMPAKTSGASGMGLRIMEHRCGLVGGTLKIEAAPGGGTVVSCRLNRERERA
ncbi:MAG TPA: chemotaxis protein CheB [Pirellulales bacterium]|jgi:signal transduction histidine kinase|nr:chemotaxis protein CheB [Pirellulales bacterium]